MVKLKDDAEDVLLRIWLRLSVFRYEAREKIAASH